MITRSRIRMHHRWPATYGDLTKLLQPRAIRDDDRYLKSIDMVDRLSRVANPTAGQVSYMNELADLIRTYEHKRNAAEAARLKGEQLLKHLMTTQEFTGADLAKLLGLQASAVSKLLTGRRSITPEHAKLLGGHFKLPPGRFLDD